MDKAVTIKGTRRGYKSNSVIVWPDNSMSRGDTDLSICTGIRNLTDAGKIVGMTRDEFIAARNNARNAV